MVIHGGSMTTSGADECFIDSLLSLRRWMLDTPADKVRASASSTLSDRDH